MDPDTTMPVNSLYEPFHKLITKGPVVLTSPTGSGKSTQIPRWSTGFGKVLVIEPRRVACRSLAVFVSELERSPLGKKVGYNVRDDHRASPNTQILFATPGIVIRMLAGGDLKKSFKTVIVDEFHERSLDGDLLLAILQKRFKGHLIVMSATIDADRVARHIGGKSLYAEGRLFPVSSHYVGGSKTLLPEIRGLDSRFLKALEQANRNPGDILVFLPGKAEIAQLAGVLRNKKNLDVITLHGGLSLKEQSRAFAPSKLKKVILSTNVAETSVTLPGIGVVIDSGLVRQTRYHNGRGFLTLVPIAIDSANQRMGRAGRMSAGVCYRLWSEKARLEPLTKPEMYRESLSPLVLAVASCKEYLDKLPWLDPPKPHAIEKARQDLIDLQAIDQSGKITIRGQKLFGLPLDAPLAGLLIEAQKQGGLQDVVDLVSILAVDRSLFISDKRPTDPETDLRKGGCDGTAFIQALRMGNPAKHGLNSYTLYEARSINRRLREIFGLNRKPPNKNAAIDRKKLALIALAANPSLAYVARKRKRSTTWANGGTEIELGRHSAIDPEKTDLLAALSTQAVGLGFVNTKIFITCAIPLKKQWMLEAGLGREKLAKSFLDKGRVMSRIEITYARKILTSREEIPRGELARQAIAQLFMDGRIFPGALKICQDRLSAIALWHRLLTGGLVPEHLSYAQDLKTPVSDPKTWVLDKLKTMEVESGDEVELLSAQDLHPPQLPELVIEWLNREFPRECSVGDAKYDVSYNPATLEVLLTKTRGTRKTPPDLTYLPRFAGFRIKVKDRAVIKIIRERM